MIQKFQADSFFWLQSVQEGGASTSMGSVMHEGVSGISLKVEYLARGCLTRKAELGWSWTTRQALIWKEKNTAHT